jgi:hypothetical protein
MYQIKGSPAKESTFVVNYIVYDAIKDKKPEIVVNFTYQKWMLNLLVEFDL